MTASVQPVIDDAADGIEREIDRGRGAGPRADRPSRPIRVMHVVFTLRSGGMEHGVVKVVNGLDPQYVVSSICSTTPADPGMRELVRHDVPVFELDRRAGNDPSFVWKFYRLLRRERPDVLHTHAWGTLLEGIVAARLARVPVIVHGEHGTLQLASRQVTAQRWAWQHVDHLLSVSSRLAERMSRDVGTSLERIRVIRNGVNLARFSGRRDPGARAGFGLPDGCGPVIGAVGRLVPVKDHATFLEAIRLLTERGRRVGAVIAGDGPLREALAERVAQLGLQDVVRLLGHRPDVEAVFAGLDVFVQSSTSEGMSNTILEAMASGLPVVATAVGGADEMVVEGETGTLVPPGSAEALAGGIERVLEVEETRAAMGAAAYRRAHSEFSLDRMVGSYQSFYREVMTRTRAQA